MTLEESHGEATQPTEIVAQGAFPCATVVLAKGHVQDPVHRFDAPVPANCLREAFAAQIARADVITHFACFLAVCLLRPAHCIADRLHVRPILSGCKVARRLGEIISSFVNAAVGIVTRFVDAILEVFEVTFDLLVKERFDGGFEFGLIVFDSNDAVAFPDNDLFDDFFLTAHGVDGDDGIGQADLFEKLWNGRDFVGFGIGGNLSQSDAFLAGPGTDDVERTEVFASVVRTATRFTVDGDKAVGACVVTLNGVGDPVLEAALEGFGFESDQESANAVTRGDTIGQGKKLGQPVLPRYSPPMHRGGAIASAQDSTDSEEGNIKEKVSAIACVSGIGKRLEVRRNGANVNELGHERYPCNRGVGQRKPTVARDQPITHRYKDIKQHRKAQDHSDYPFMRAGPGFDVAFSGVEISNGRN